MATQASLWWGAFVTPSCSKLLRSYLLVTEHGYKCPPHYSQTSRYAAHAGLVVPFLSIIDIDPSPGLPAERPIFARYQASCSRGRPSTSMLMRTEFVKAWTPLGADVKASRDPGGWRPSSPAVSLMNTHLRESLLVRKQVLCRENVSTTHPDLEAEYRQSQFCPLLAGDSAATWRLPEVLMAGCIPVFLFPPLHTVPLPYDVAWKDIAIFINITQARQLWYAEERCVVRCPCAHLTVCLPAQACLCVQQPQACR